MKKYVIVLLSLLMILCICGCSKKKEVTDTPEEIEQKIAQAIGVDKYLGDTDIEKEKLFERYDLDEDQIESYVAKENSDSEGNPDQIIVMKAKEGYADTAVKKINKAYEKIVEDGRKSSNGLVKILNARIYNEDPYVIFILTSAPYDGSNKEVEVMRAKKDYENVDNVFKEIFGDVPSNVIVIPPTKAKK